MRFVHQTVLPLLTCGALLISAALAQAADLPPRAPSPLYVRQIHSGHSLTDSYMAHPWPGRLILATKAASRRVDPHETIAGSTIPGAPLHWRWRNAPGYGAPDARADIGDYELLVTTETVPLGADPQSFETQTLDMVETWVRHAWENGNGGRGAEVMLYSTWVAWPSQDNASSFRRRLEAEGESWERMQDHANATRPAGMPPIYMIPGHRLMMRLAEDIEAGRAPGLDRIGDIFADDIHLNDRGQYAVTCLVFAVIYQRNPKDLPDRLAVPDDTLSPEQAAYFKALAWEVANAYARAGLP